MSSQSQERPDEERPPNAALKERSVILIASLGAILGGFFPWAQPLDLDVWGYDDGDGLITMASGIMTFMFVWLEWRQITVGAAVFFGAFISVVAAVNYTPNLGPVLVISAIAGAVITIAGLSAIRRFRSLDSD